MAERHKWADVIIAIAEGRAVQFVSRQTGVFIDYEPTVHTSPMMGIDVEWRIKPRTIKIGDMEVPEPLRSFQPGIQTYYVVDLQDADEEENSLYYATPFDDDCVDYRLLNRGICHATPQAAIAHAKALIAVSGGQV